MEGTESGAMLILLGFVLADLLAKPFDAGFVFSLNRSAEKRIYQLSHGDLPFGTDDLKHLVQVSSHSHLLSWRRCRPWHPYYPSILSHIEHGSNHVTSPQEVMFLFSIRVYKARNHKFINTC